ncbi:MAG: lysophospholipase [Burkholderiales bacterium]|nr:lysophospholipase [Burkholderiales bacterium]
MVRVVLPTHLAARDGLKLRTYHYPIERPHGLAVFLHGLCEHAGRYADVAAHLNEQGWAVVSYDHRGHGQSEGARGTVQHDDDYLHDLAAVLDAAEAAYPQLPRILVGASMGGLMAARMASAWAEPPEHASWARTIDGIVLAAPALEPSMTLTQKALLSAFGKLVPDLAVPVGLKADWCSSDPAVVADIEADPLIHQRITPRLTQFILDNGQAVMERAARWTCPTLLLYSEADRLVQARACDRFAAEAPRSVVTASRYVDLAHALFHEPKKHLVYSNLNSWLKTQFPSRALAA